MSHWTRLSVEVTVLIVMSEALDWTVSVFGSDLILAVLFQLFSEIQVKMLVKKSSLLKRTMSIGVTF